MWTAFCSDTQIVPTCHVGDRSHGTAHRVCLESRRQVFSPSPANHGRLFDLPRSSERVFWRSGRLLDAGEAISHRGCGHEQVACLWWPEPVPRLNVPSRAAKFEPAPVFAPFYPQDNAFSKKLTNHALAVALYFLHWTLSITLAVVAGATSALRMDWLIDEAEPAPNKDLSQMSRRPLPSRCLHGRKGERAAIR